MCFVVKLICNFFHLHHIMIIIQVGWTTSHHEGSSSKSRNIRPMHVRLSVRIHHVSFLHPGLDAGGSTLTTNRGKKKTFLPKKNDTPAGAPGPMAFGQRRGSWKNPTKSKGSNKKNGNGDHDSMHPRYVEETPTRAADTAEVTEIISSEAFRLSRDGIIQQHYALMQQDAPAPGGVISPREAMRAADMAETARYYKECAKRPKGYRRLVVSSMIPTEDENIPSPPIQRQNSQVSLLSKFDDKGFDRASSKLDNEETDDSFNHVEYRYIGPPNTGPAFFQILRQNGAASFGRFLPEVACSVPKHSIAFELCKSKGITKRGGSATTQPIVIEAPHVIWGDARDKTLARIAREGCPLIDAREFEYVSNSNLKDAELSETLMVCGATVWVKDATDKDFTGTARTIRSKNRKTMIKAEYYGGKMADGVKKTAKGMAKVLSPSKKDKTGDTSVSVVSPSDASVTSETPTKKKKVKFGLLRRKKKKGADGDAMSVNSMQSGLDDESIISQASAPGVFNSTALTTDHQSREFEKESISEEGSLEYGAVKSVPYVLIADSVINIQIVSFPQKDIIAKFPISVASVMAQRNIDERMSNPLRPSELTATLIQEPSAPNMQWGCELKVTVRAVEVKPQLPRPISSLNSVQNELKHARDTLISLGKSKAEVDEALREKEREMSENENNLNQAIISAGMGRGEYDGAAVEEIRKQQMFYDEREFQSVKRTVKRRGVLSKSQRNLLKDARYDPAVSMGRSSVVSNQDKVLKLIETHFPGVDESNETTPKSSSRKRNSADIRASISLAIAEDLDENLGEYLDTPTVELVQQSLEQQSALGQANDSPMTEPEVKKWCYDLASKISLQSEQSTRSISQIQSLLVASAGGTASESLVNKKEVSPNVLDEVNGWRMGVLSKLDSCAEELDDHQDGDESFDYSVYDETIEESEEIESQKGLTGAGDSEKSPKGSAAVNPEIDLFVHQSFDNNNSNNNDSDSMGSDDAAWQQATSRGNSDIMNSSNLQRVLRASALATFDEAVSGKDTGRGISTSHQAEPLLKSMRESHFKIHRSYNTDDSTTKAKGSSTVTTKEEPVPKAYNRTGYRIATAFVVLLGATVLAAKYHDIVLHDIVLIVNQK